MEQTRDEMINQAIEELYFVRLGGQNAKEFLESTTYIRDVLLKLKEESCPVCDTLMCADHLTDD